MQVVRINKLSYARRIRAEWNRLAPPTPMHTADWMLSWWWHYGQHFSKAELLLMLVRDGHGDLAGVAPWFQYVHPVRGPAIEFLGTGRVCSDHLGLICRAGQAAEVADALADWIRCQPPLTSWGSLRLESVDEDDAVMQRFVSRLEEAGLCVERTPADTTWHFELPPSWEAFLKSCSKNHRKRCRRWQRTYFDTGRATLQVTQSAAELDANFALLVQLHNLRRRYLREPGVFEVPVFSRFHRDVAEMLLENGQLRLARLDIDGQPAAVEYQLLSPTSMYAYQCGMDPTVIRDGPGNLSLMASIQSAIEMRLTTFDFMRGGETYKTHWGAQPRLASTITVRPGNLVGRLQHNVATAARSAKDVMRNGRDLLRRQRNTEPDGP